MADLTARPITLVHPPDPAGKAPQRLLESLGFTVTLLWPMPLDLPEKSPVLLVAVTKKDLASPIRLLNSYRGIRIAVIDSESPQVLDTIAACEVHAVLHKPVQRAGLRAQLAVAVATHRYAVRPHDRLAHVEANLRARRIIQDATRVPIAERGVSEHDAYEFLRHDAMRCRLPIGTMAATIMAERGAPTDSRE